MDGAIVAENARDQSDNEAADTEYYLVKTPEPEPKSPILTKKTPESRGAYSPKDNDSEAKSRAAHSLVEKASNIDTPKDGGSGSSSAHSLPANSTDGLLKENLSPAEVAQNGASAQLRRETQDFEVPKVDTEQAKARYLKNVRAAWGDGFQVGIPWPDPPGKTFLEDILRLIKNERVTLDEFRPGILAIYRERTKGATNHLTGWGRFISRGDLKIFLQRRQNSQVVSANMVNSGTHAPSSSMNQEPPFMPPRQALVNRESAYTPREIASRQEDARPSDAGNAQNGSSGAQYSSPYYGPREAEQQKQYHHHHQQPQETQHDQRQQPDIAQRTHDSSKEMSYTPAATHYQTPQERSPQTSGLPPPPRSPYVGVSNQNGGQHGASSDSPSQNSPQIPVNPSHVRFSGEKNTQTPHGSPAFLASRALPLPLSASSSPQIKNRETPAGSPQFSTAVAPSPAALPKCYTCENRMSRQWHPYPVAIQDASSKSFQTMEYQCESCYLQRIRVDTNDKPLPQGGQLTWPKSPRQSQNTPSGFNGSAPASNTAQGSANGPSAAASSRFISERPDMPPQRTRKEKWSAWQPKPVDNAQQELAKDAGDMIHGQDTSHATSSHPGDSWASERQVQHGQPGPPVDLRSQNNSTATTQAPEAVPDRLPAFEAYQKYQEMQRKHASASATATAKTAVNNSPTMARQTPPAAPAAVPGKEDNSKKRSFAEIIDLTEDTLVESIERDEPVQKMSKVGPGPGPGPALAESYGGPYVPLAQPTHSQQNMNGYQAPSFAHQNVSHQHHHSMPKANVLQPQQPPPPPVEILVEPLKATIRKNGAVWRLKEYNTQTVASDILRAIGQHPNRPGLNEHLNTLKGRFGVDHKSDLSTFRWDYARKDVAAQAHYTMPPALDPPRSYSNIPPPILQSGRSNNGMPGPAYATTGSFTPHAPSSLRNTSTPILPAAIPSVALHPNSQPIQPLSSSSHSHPMVAIEPRPVSDVSRTYTHVYPPSHIPLHTSQAPAQPPSNASSTLKKRGRPSTKNLPASGSIPLRPGASPQSAPKKRGRPFSKNLPPSSIPQSASEDSSIPKKRGRPFKKPKDEGIPEGKYLAFLCEWEDCPAELQNLETLRAHIFANHVVLGENRKFSCAWGKCSKINDGKPLDFDGSLVLEEHIEHQHLRSFAWHMGDGPRGTSLDARSVSSRRSFLEDENGRQVTPSVADQEIEKGKAKINNERREKEKQKQTDGPSVVLNKMKPIEGVPAFDDTESPAEESSA